MIQSVDLAAKFSAVILRERSGQVVGQFDSRGLSPFQFAAKIGRTARECEMTVVEDVPYGITQQGMVKPPLRFQGLVMMACWKNIEDLYFLDPARWMNAFEGVRRIPKEQSDGMSKLQVQRQRELNMRNHAKQRGYEPPDLVQAYIDANPGKKILKKDTGPLEKNVTDYVAAFLISEFVISQPRPSFVAHQGVSPAYI